MAHLSARNTQFKDATLREKMITLDKEVSRLEIINQRLTQQHVG